MLNEAHAVTIQHSTFNIQHSRLSLPRGGSLTFGSTPLVLGILNVTPDSFSDGGVHFDHAKAVHAAPQIAADGAAVTDAGGERTRPGAEPIAAQTEVSRAGPRA